jgi:membrane protein implicated in regulation of membrane protease activity
MKSLPSPRPTDNEPPLLEARPSLLARFATWVFVALLLGAGAAIALVGVVTLAFFVVFLGVALIALALIAILFGRARIHVLINRRRSSTRQENSD